MPYLIRFYDGSFTIAITFRGALNILRDGTMEAAIYTLFGRWIAGRVVSA
jgi:hypothetical protein